MRTTLLRKAVAVVAVIGGLVLASASANADAAASQPAKTHVATDKVQQSNHTQKNAQLRSVVDWWW